jgi:2-polyprenyl-6-methoxyphenol hydroxylase-like FAD-dependent oxidoreductase
VAKVSKVLIVGGGVAGMSCAIQMRQAGIAVDLVGTGATWC